MNILCEILEKNPRRRLFDSPSPVQRLTRLEKYLGKRIEIYIKRDDLLRPLFGNKLRYLEFILGQFDKHKCNSLVHGGGWDSNYMTQVAMLGAQEGIPVHLVIRKSDENSFQGNSLLIDLYGANLTFLSEEDSITNSSHKQDIAAKLSSSGGRPYVIDYPFSNFSAILGYVRAYIEIRQQILEGLFPDPDQIVLCSGGNSYLGLRIAADLCQDFRRITAYTASRFNDLHLNTIFESRENFLQNKVKEFGDYVDKVLETNKFDVDEGYVGLRYGLPSEASMKAVRLMSSTEGILLDPIYNGKAMAALIERIVGGSVKEGSRILFIHTGGLANVFRFGHLFAESS